MITTQVYLTQDQRTELEHLIRAEKSSARVQTRARILLLSDKSQGNRRLDAEVAQALMISTATVGRIRRRFVEEGLESALKERPRPGAIPKITGDIEAKLTVVACSKPPAGYDRWALKLLAEELIALDYVESITPMAICKRLKKLSKTLADKDMVHIKTLRQVCRKDGRCAGCIPASI